MLMSAVRRCPRALAFLALVACGWPLLTSPSATCDPLAGLGDLGPPDHGIFSPLLKALSEHGGSRWDPELRRRMKPDGRTVRYLTDVYKRPSGLRRRRCNTVRLIKPKEECFAQSHGGESVLRTISFMGWKMKLNTKQHQAVAKCLLMLVEEARPVITAD